MPGGNKDQKLSWTQGKQTEGKLRSQPHQDGLMDGPLKEFGSTLSMNMKASTLTNIWVPHTELIFWKPASKVDTVFSTVFLKVPLEN